MNDESEIVRCENCGVEQSELTCGHSDNHTGSLTWWCSMRCYEGLKHSAQLLLIRGLPGSGKSTLARSHFVRARWPFHIEADMVHMQRGEYVYDPRLGLYAHRWCLDTTRTFLNNGLRVVVSNTFVTLDEMQPYMELGFEVAVEEMKHSWGSTHNVPDEVIDHMRKRWQELP